MKKFKLLFVVCILAVLASCGGGDKMDMKGTWKIDNVELGEGFGEEEKKMAESMMVMITSAVTIEVEEEGKFNMKMSMMGKSEEEAGEYKFDGDSLSITAKGETKSAKILEHEAGMIKLEMAEDGKTTTVTLKRDQLNHFIIFKEAFASFFCA